MINFAIIEDDEEIREYLQSGLCADKDYQCTLVAGSVEYFLRFAEANNPPDLMLLDINLPGMSGTSGLPFLKEKFPDMEIIMLTNYDDTRRIFASLSAGASGYLLKSTSLRDIQASIKLALDGGAPMSPQIGRKVLNFFRPEKKADKTSTLTSREKEVVQGLVDGLSYKQIADRLSISVGTIFTHIKNIYKKLQVNSKAEVIVKSLRGEL